jgi:hypothetical protein
MFVLEYLSALSKKQATCGKNPSDYIPYRNEHLHSKATEFTPYMEDRRVRPLLTELLAGAQFIFSSS